MKRQAAHGTALLLAWVFLSVHAFAGVRQEPTQTTSPTNGANQAARAEGSQQSGGDATADGRTEGKVRVGLAGVKAGTVGAGVGAAELAGAIQSTLAEYLKGTKIEVVRLEARLASAAEAEAKEKGCDYVLYATVSHKKGGGGFGMFKAIAPVLGSVVPMAGVAGVGSMIAGQVAQTAINAAATANVKPKDELTLEIKLQKGSAVALARQFKAKAKGAGEDVVSPLVEQAATALVETVGK